MTKKKKRIIIISIVITFVILSVAALYANLKVFTIKKVFMSAQQEVYIMGTFHTEHFERYANYSIEEMINAVNNIEPDVVFIEARENSFTEYGVVDGPIDMCIAYSYCSDNNIPVEMIDYWEITNDSKTNTTTTERDDHIHNNIMEKLTDYENKRILVICGFGHLNAQTERLIEAGGQNNILVIKVICSKEKMRILFIRVCYVMYGKKEFFSTHIRFRSLFKKMTP